MLESVISPLCLQISFCINTCSLSPINTSFFGTLSPPCQAASSNPSPWWRHCSRSPITLAISSSSSNRRSSSSTRRNGRQLHRPWGQFSPSFFSCRTFISCKSTYSALSFLLFPFSCSSNLQTFRNWLRKWWFPLTDPTFNVSGH